MKKIFTYCYGLILVFLVNVPLYGQPVFLKEVPLSSNNFVSSNGKLYFTAGDSLMRSDGTSGGTVFVKKIGEEGIILTGLTAGSYFFFTTNDRKNLWRSDGTAANTVKVASGFLMIQPLLVFKNELYLMANDGSTGVELWKATPAGSLTIVKDFNPGPGDGFGGELIISQDQLFFKASSGSGGNNIWKTDGTASGTALAVDLPIEDFSCLTNVDGMLFFARNYNNMAELWKSDGSEAGTVMVKKYNLAEQYPDEGQDENISRFISLGGKLHFVHYDYSAVYGYYHAVSDGTLEGTRDLEQISIDGYLNMFQKALNQVVHHNNCQSFPGNMGAFGGTGESTWFYGAKKDITKVVEAGGYIFFTDAVDGYYGPESYDGYNQLWQSDLTKGNTKAVKQLFAGTSFSGAGNLTAADGKLFFTTYNDYYDAPDSLRKKRLWIYDPTKPAVPRPYFTLVNADTDKDLQWLKEGDIVIKSPNTNISIRYNAAGSPGSVVFKLADTVRRIENGAPYLLAGDVNGNYSPWLEAQRGNHRITAIPYTQANGTGTAGPPLVVNFTIMEEGNFSGPVVNAGPDREIILPKDSVILTASAHDPDGWITSQSWYLLSGPVYPYMNYGNPVYVSQLKEGEYLFGFSAYDNYGNGALDTVKVTVRRSATVPEVLSFTLVNADTDEDIMTIFDGQNIFWTEIGTKNVNIRANISGVPASKVVLNLDGATIRTEGSAPYTLYGDVNGDYNGGEIRRGSHLLTVTPYTTSGKPGLSKTVSFNTRNYRFNNNPSIWISRFVTLTLPQDTATLTASAYDEEGIDYVQWKYLSGPGYSSMTLESYPDNGTYKTIIYGLKQGVHKVTFTAWDVEGLSSIDTATITVNPGAQPAGPQVESFVLVNADTDQDIRVLNNLDTLDLAMLPPHLNIRAQTMNEAGSVVMVYAGIRRTESKAPYSLFGDNNGDFASGDLYRGNADHTIEATAYTGTSATGTAGNTLKIRLYIKPASNARYGSAEENGFALSAYPNPSPDRFIFRVKNSYGNEVYADIYTGDGHFVSRILQRHAEEGEDLEFSWDATGKEPGAYVCKFRSGSSELSRKIILK